MNFGIGFTKDIDKVKKIVDFYCTDKKMEIKEHDNSRYMFYIDKFKNSFLMGKDFYDILTDMILEIMLKIYSDDIIEEQINNIANNLKLLEKKKVAEISKEILLDKDKFTVEKKYIYNKVKGYISETSIIWVDGFLQFRLGEFDLLIDVVVKEGIKEFNAKKEYKEFIKILQYFVDAQEPKYNLVNLIFEDGNYKLYDEMNNIIDNNFFKNIIKEIGNESISKDDLLVSSLIVIAPKKLKIHIDGTYNNKDVIRIISNVFQNRVYFCYGCNQCNKRTKKKTDKR